MDLRALQSEIDAWIRANGGYWDELSLLARLAEETGEVARLYNHRFGDKGRTHGPKEGDLAGELADVLWIVLCMANQQGLDMEGAFGRTMDKLRSRDSGRTAATPPVLDHVQIAAPPGCDEAARAFFGGLLGLPEVPKRGETASTGGAWFRAGDRGLHVGVDPDFRPSRKAHVALRVEGGAALESLASRLEGAGHAVRWDKRLPGIRRFFTDDPWGNRIEVQAG